MRDISTRDITCRDISTRDIAARDLCSGGHSWADMPVFEWTSKDGGLTSKTGGDLVAPIITGADNLRYVFDHEDIARPLLGGEIGNDGMRRVHNLLTNSDSPSTRYVTLVAGLSYVFSATGVSDYDLFGLGVFETVEITNPGERRAVKIVPTSSGVLTISTNIAGDNFQLELTSGNSDDSLPGEYVSSGVGTGSEELENTGGPFTSLDGFTAPGSATLALNGNDILFNRNFASGSQVNGRTTFTAVAGKLYVIKLSMPAVSHLVSVRYQGVILASYSAPVTDDTLIFTAGSSGNIDFYLGGNTLANFRLSEISVKLVDHGANADGVKYFDTHNGNSVDGNGVVTEATGADIDEDIVKGLRQSGEVIELSGVYGPGYYSGGGGGRTVTHDQPDIRGYVNTASSCEDTAAGSVSRTQEVLSINSDLSTYIVIFEIGYNASPTVYPCVGMRLQGSTSITHTIVIDPSDGSSIAASSNGDVLFSERRGDFWRVAMTVTNTDAANTDLVLLAYLAWNSDGSATADSSAMGTTVFGASYVFKDLHSYYPAFNDTASPLTIPADRELTLPIVMPDAEGRMEVIVTPRWNTGLPDSAGLITHRSNDPANSVYFSATDKLMPMRDGTNLYLNANSWNEVSQTILIKEQHGEDPSDSTNKMQMSVDLNAGTLTAFDGSFDPSGDPTIAKNLALTYNIKAIKIYNTRGEDAYLITT